MLLNVFPSLRSLRLRTTMQKLVTLLVFIALSVAGIAQDFTLDFEQFSGQLTADKSLFGISFGQPTVDIDESKLNGVIGPVNVQVRERARSGIRLAANCTEGIDCEFPDGAVLMEFSDVQPVVSFFVNGIFDSENRFLIYRYDLEGVLELVATPVLTSDWQEVVVENAFGIIIDTDPLDEGASGAFGFWLDDITFNQGAINVDPVASLDASPTSGEAPLIVVFDGSKSFDPDEESLDFSWDFGDGGDGTGAIIEYRYETPGSYLATLIVTDESGARSTDTITITVNEPPNEIECIAADEFQFRLQNDEEFRRNNEEIEEFTNQFIQNLANEDPYALEAEVITIPVVVHVVYETVAENISDLQIQSQIESLNEFFRRANADVNTVPAPFSPLAADFRLQFELAKRDPDCNPTDGITRTSTTVSAFTRSPNSADPLLRNPVKFSASGGTEGWPPEEYLNIWVCDLAGPHGYASFPADLTLRPQEDGVVVDYQVFGTVGPNIYTSFNLGRIAGHEIGHWLNLHHVWGDGNPGSCTDTDYVDDTPNQGNRNIGCPNFPDISCSNGPDGDMFMNNMDYTLDKSRTMFSLGQHVRAMATLFGVRSSLIGSDALVPPSSSLTADLWSMDTPDDIGEEPNNSSYVMYHSADIWVRNTNDGFTIQQHQNPLYRTSGDPNYVYVRVRNRGCTDAQSGTVTAYWAKAGSGLSWPVPWDGSVGTPALMGSPLGTGSVVIDAGDFQILEFPWVVPDPADYASFGADQAHFCLLSRIETSGGMTFPETTDLYANVQNNNNIVWKNITISTTEEGGLIGQVLVGNFFPEDMTAQLRFNLPEDELLSLFDWGEVTADLGDLFAVWQDSGGEGEGVELIGENRVLLTRPGASIIGFPLASSDLFGIEVQFIPATDTSINNVFKLNMDQIDLTADRVVGGQQFVFRTIAEGVIPPGRRDPSITTACPEVIPQECDFPITVGIDLNGVAPPDNRLGNFTGTITWDTSEISYIGPSVILSGFTGAINVDTTGGRIVFNGASAQGAGGEIPVLEAQFQAKGATGTVVMPEVTMRTLVSAETFVDLLPDAQIVQCDLVIVPSLLLGDVDGDGVVTSTDAAFILAYSVGNEIPDTVRERISAGAGDVDMDLDTDPDDALIILTFDVGLPVEFPVGSANVCTTDEGLKDPSSIDVRSGGIPVSVEVHYQEMEPGIYFFPIVVDLTNIEESLGSYLVEMKWDTEEWSYTGFVGGENELFRTPVINEREAVDGTIRWAYANAIGAGGRVNIGTIKLRKEDHEALNEPDIDLDIPTLTAAQSFRKLVPEVTITEGALTTNTARLSNNPSIGIKVLPNPFTNSTIISLSFGSNKPNTVDLTIYNIQGQRILDLSTRDFVRNGYVYEWDGTDQAGNRVPEGIYIVKCRSNEDLVSEMIVRVGS